MSQNDQYLKKKTKKQQYDIKTNSTVHPSKHMYIDLMPPIRTWFPIASGKNKLYVCK